jgi:hypothetical protein
MSIPSLSEDLVERSILVIRGHKVMLDADLARLYGVEVKALNQAVRRNRDRFPADFAFQLTLSEAQRSRSQIVTLNAELTENIYESVGRRGAKSRGTNLKYLPYAFTEQGVAMLSSVLHSPRAIRVNIEIMRAFVRLRRFMLEHASLAKKVAELEERYDGQFRVVFDALRDLMESDADPKEPIGFKA